MKILGAIIYLLAFLGPAYIITETRISFSDSIWGILLLVAWIGGCMLVGKILMEIGNTNNKE